MAETIELARQLIQKKSVTPEDDGCQQLIARYLEPLGFESSHLAFGNVKNLWATTIGSGPLHDGFLYGRGAADMKSSIAAMMVAAKRVMANHQLHGRLGFLITSDEEGPAVDGTVKVVDYLQQQDTKIDWCIVGEPTSTTHLGDIVKNGRRGSLNGRLTITGKQGHVAYPHLARNPVHLAADVLQQLTGEQWDNGNEFFPPTTFQISNLNAGTGVENVIPGELVCQFNFRFSTEVTAEQLKARVHELLDAHQLDYNISWRLSGNPFITGRGRLVEATSRSIEKVCGYATELSTSGGTSDGRFIAPTGAEVLELGPVNATIHQIDECVSCDDLLLLTEPTIQAVQTLPRRQLTLFLLQPGLHFHREIHQSPITCRL